MKATDKECEIFRKFTTLKNKHPGSVILLRDCGVYWACFDDAKKVAHVLNTTLITKRRTEFEMEMTTVSVYLFKRSLRKLEQAGIKVVVYDE